MTKFVYKFTHQKWARSMTEFGTIRIGTLYDYWHPRYPEGIRDESEGKIFTYRVLKYMPGDPVPPVWGTSFFGIPQGCPIQMTNVTASLAAKNTVPDMYVYCTSAVDDPVMFTAFGATYDTCVRIGPLDEFTAAISKHMSDNMKVSRSFAGPCEYGIREVVYDRGSINAHPAMLKHGSFGDQREYRFVGETKLCGIQPKVVTLTKFKHLFAIHRTS